MKQVLFFDQTTEAIRELTAVLDNFASALIAIRNMRCEVRGVLAECPEFTEEMFHARYHFDNKIRWKNYKTIFNIQPFAIQEEAFTRYLLISTFMIFEGWLDRMRRAGVITGNMSQSLQCPSLASNSLNAHTQTNMSAIMTSVFYPCYQANKKYNYVNIVAMLYCFQMFKKIRNSLVHAGRSVTQQCLSAFQDYQQYCTCASLGVSEVPQINSLVLGNTLVPSFRGVIGFTDIVIRILISYDCELVKTSMAEQYFLTKFHQAKVTNGFPSSNRGKALKELSARIRKCGFIIPANVSTLQSFLVSKGYNC